MAEKLAARASVSSKVLGPLSTSAEEEEISADERTFPILKMAKSMVEATINQKQVYFLQAANPKSRAFDLPLMITLDSTKLVDIEQPINVLELLDNIYLSVKHNEMLRISASVIDSVKLFTQEVITPYAVRDLTNYSELNQNTEVKKEIEMLADGSAFPYNALENKCYYIKVLIINPVKVIILLNHHCIVSDTLSVITHARQMLGIWDAFDKPNDEITVEQQLEMSPSLAGINKNSKYYKVEIEKFEKMIGNASKILQISNPQMPFEPKCNVVNIPMTEETMKRVLKLANALDIPLSTLIHFAVCVVLGTFVGEHDFIVGMTTENRTKNEKNFIGCYEKTLPLRIDFSNNDISIKELALKLKEDVLTVRESPLNTIDLVNNIPCLQHKPGFSSPFHVILSNFLYDQLIQTSATIDGIMVHVQMDRKLQMHTHSDLTVEVHQASSVSSDAITYKYSKGCLSFNVIRLLHTEVNRFLGILSERKLDEPIHVPSLLPSIVNLSKFHISNISTALTPLDLPTNVMQPSTEPDAATTKAVGKKPAETVEESGYQYNEVRLSVPIDKSRNTDNVLLCLLGYLVCNYTNQRKIGIVYIKNRRVFCFYFAKLAGALRMIEQQFDQLVKCTTPEGCYHSTTVREFNCMMELIPKEMKTTYLVWCLDETTPDVLSNDCGLHVNCLRKDRGSPAIALLKFKGREPWFDEQALRTFVDAFETYHNDVMSKSNPNLEVQEVICKEHGLQTVCDSGLKFTNIEDLNKTYLQLFEETATSTENKDSIAIVYKNEYMTYGYMLKNITNLARTIVQHNQSGNGYVGVYMHRSPWLYISMFACLKSGRAYVPISLRSSKDDIFNLVEDLHICLILTESTLLDKLEKMNVETICIDNRRLPKFNTSTQPPRLSISSPSSVEDIMCVQFIPPTLSSDTSSKPQLKYVKFSHKNVVHVINNIMSLTTVDECKVTLASTSVLYDAHIIDSLTPLLRGSCIVIVDDLSCIVPDVTHAFATPSAICCVQKFPNSIASLVVGGETFTDACRKKTRQLRKVTRIYTSPECAVFAASTDQYKSSDPDNIGNITSGYGFKVTNAYGHSVPTGFPGILHLYSKNLLTCEPKTDKLGYCTGDLVRFLPDETFQLLSKKEVDCVVQWKEDRVNLLSVENALYSFPLVKSACAFVHKQNTSNAVLVAFVVPEDIPIDQLMFHLENFVPSYMVPKVILAVDRLPLDEFGRMDKAKLHTIIGRRESIAVGRVDDTVGLLKQICSIFADIVGVSPEYYRPTHNFFTHGGDSILALALIDKLNVCLDCNTDVKTLLAYSTPNTILEHVMTTMIRRIRVPKCDLPVAERQRKESSATGKVTFYVELNADSDRIESRNLFPKRHFNPLADTKSETLKKRYIEVSSCAPNDFSLKYTDDFDDEQYDHHIIYLPKHHRAMSPVQRYLCHYLPMQYISMIFSPNCMHDFEFLIDVPPYLIRKDVFEACDYTAISKELREDRVQNITPDIVKAYIENCVQPEVVLVQHAKVQFLTTQITKDPVNMLGITLLPDDVPVFFVFMDFAGCGYFSSFSSLEKYRIPAVSLIRTVDTPFTSFENLAAYYVDIILKKQPQGPYKLVGRLYGASLAYEIAHQLVAKGHQIKVLMMIDDSPVHENRPALFDPSGYALPQTSLDPAVFFTYLLALKFPHENLESSQPYQSLLERVIDVILKEHQWVFLTREQLLEVYMMFYLQLKCLWEYSAQPTMTGIEKCVLIRDKDHPFFKTKDFGLSKLVNDSIIITKYSSLTDSIDMAIETLKLYL